MKIWQFGSKTGPAPGRNGRQLGHAGSASKVAGLGRWRAPECHFLFADGAAARARSRSGGHRVIAEET